MGEPFTSLSEESLHERLLTCISDLFELSGTDKEEGFHMAEMRQHLVGFFKQSRTLLFDAFWSSQQIMSPTEDGADLENISEEEGFGRIDTLIEKMYVDNIDGEELDANHDGRITFDELVSFIARIGRQQGGNRKRWLYTISVGAFLCLTRFRVFGFDC